MTDRTETSGAVLRPSMAGAVGARMAAAGGEFLRSRLAVIGLIIVLIQVAMAILAPILAPFPPNQMDYAALLQGPGAVHPFGTDELGRDILSRVMYGARLSLWVGVAAVALAAAIGVPIGLIAGYFGGIIDEVLMRFLDGFIALPPLVLALTIAAVLGSGLGNAMLAIAIVAVPTFARLVRGQVMSVKENEYILAAEAVGVRLPIIIARHVLPNAINPVIVQSSLAVGFSIIIESSLSFIGLGAQPPTATWGTMVKVGFQYLELAPWYALVPAAMIFFAVLGFNMLGEGLRHVLDPTSRNAP